MIVPFTPFFFPGRDQYYMRFFFFFFFFCFVFFCGFVVPGAPEGSTGSRFLGEARDRKKVQVGKDQEKAQSEKDSHTKNRGGKKPN